MPRLNITNMSFTLNQPNVNVIVDFRISQTETEKRLKIPARVWFRLMEKDESKDDPYLSAQVRNGYLTTGEDNDDPAGGWHRVKVNGKDLLEEGTYKEEFSRQLSQLPADGLPWDIEEWYVLGECRADILDDVSLSEIETHNV